MSWPALAVVGAGLDEHTASTKATQILTTAFGTTVDRRQGPAVLIGEARVVSEILIGSMRLGSYGAAGC